MKIQENIWEILATVSFTTCNVSPSQCTCNYWLEHQNSWIYSSVQLSKLNICSAFFKDNSGHINVDLQTHFLRSLDAFRPTSDPKVNPEYHDREVDTATTKPVNIKTDLHPNIETNL